MATVFAKALKDLFLQTAKAGDAPKKNSIQSAGKREVKRV